MFHASWGPLTVVVLLAALTFWLGRVASTQLPGTVDGFAHDPDYIVENFVATTYDIQGTPRHWLSAKRMTHFMDDDSTALEELRFKRQDGVAAPISVQSNKGLVTAEGEEVYFIGDVHVARPSLAGVQAMELTTDYLKVIPDADILRTDKPVTLRQGASVVAATGLVADGNKRLLQLTGRVKATYEKRN
jgi:lipopolysaccharide export system protein LptC